MEVRRARERDHLPEGDELSLEDRRLLAEDVADLPEPLVAIYCPGDGNGAGHELGYGGRVGSLPYFVPMTQVPADVGEHAIRVAGEKLKALYPPVREEARVVLVNPETTENTSRAIDSLQARKGFKHAHLLIARTHGDRGTPPADPTLDELFAERRDRRGVLWYRRQGR